MISKKIINHLTKHGKKSVGNKIWKNALKKIQKTSLKSVKSIIQLALINAAPVFKIHKISFNRKNKRKKTQLKEIPVFIKKHNIRLSISIKNIISTSSRNGTNASTTLAKNFLLTSENKGTAITLKKNIQEKVLPNKQFFRYYRW